MVVDVEGRVDVGELERLLSDVYELLMVGDFEGAAERVSVLFTPPYVEVWKPRARRAFAKLRGKLEVKYGKRISPWYLSRRGVDVITHAITSSILQHLGFSSFFASKVALVVGGAAAKMFENLVRGWRRSVCAMAVMYATQLEEGFGVPYAVAFKMVTLAVAVAFYIAANPSVIDELYGERVEAR